ncbi:MAG: PHB depolymerase family esterase [Bradyrhizobium sp.]|uniref:extracellular catalytic domain type 1 short-chain-length polyhydroxyalkanoate depolymerase n=1 Tax=Bradyrhizobium sp. TaxID=376 RepID=UPI001D65C533|nr:PHB depolymerase family esterase [Bradyrhizobium sp.]MBV9562856.1 PHB depolymerase family esterase [Bradyrhizobium sp.]
MSLASNVEFLKRLPKPVRLPGLAELARGLRPDLHSPLFEVKGFGTNPGSLRMLAFVPASLQQPRPLVVVLHGCGQTAAGYDLGAGWSTLAKHFGFALLMPEQQASNNANACFNWFNPEDIARDGGEACSIRQMIARMVRDYSIDPHRIFVTGLSAGGAMTSVMLATYPEVFAAGAVIAGLPFGVATNLREALSGMRGGGERSARELGDRVRDAANHRGRWPRVSVWHGGADRVVHPGNANEIVKQWLDVHQLPSAPMAEGVVDGHPRQVWWDADGETMVESYTIADMAHGTPLGMADNDKYYGNRGAFLIEAGISSSYHIAKFFGLTAWIREPKKVEAKMPVADSPSAKLIPSVSPLPIPLPDLARVLAPLANIAARPERKAAAKGKPKSEAKPRRRAIDLSAIVTRALTAAGLRRR